MKTTAWRITRDKYAGEAFSGEGAKRFGGRWNPSGVPAVYAAQHLSLAILELVVHLETEIDIQHFIAIPVSFDFEQVFVLPKSQLPDGWDNLPICPATQEVGRKWLEGKTSLVLQVPSSIVPIEHNYVINPQHPDFPEIEIGAPESIRIDERLAL
ncbi:conserved hypothetical protein [Desulfosarcina cetonica]|uniref:RES family NAD+ phosphorylase n=1 Tax=Desulfosarcina cetonica TaxID=90730 RepID=UPI0006D280E3|nr:RES family NAD+ phosphorylase [Desulfosarcina cetonica]VTR71561.1 conserved hypothetical protein [Desulfosarcina cetonica]